MTILPIAISSPSAGLLHCVTWLPYRIEQVDANTHNGTLLGEAYTTRLTSANAASWTVLDGGLVAPRLAN